MAYFLSVLFYLLLFEYFKACYSAQPSVWDKVRSERINSEICETEISTLGEFWDLCNKNGTISHEGPDMMNRDDFYSSSCFCDDLCKIYGDCCMDVMKDHNFQDHSWQCRELPHIGKFVYMIQKCSSDWKGINIRDLCENEVVDMYIKGREFNHLQTLPVHSIGTNRFYRNIYCALCNNDANIQKWKADIRCNQSTNISQIHNLKLEDYGEYRPMDNKWMINIDNHRVTCSIIIQDFLKTTSFIKSHGLRLCRKAEHTCFPWSNEYDRQMCLSYTSFVYEIEQKKLKNIYKNYHCAKCRGADLNKLSCHSNFSGIIMRTDVGRSWYPIILDFNFGGKEGNEVGTRVKCPSTHEQLYDPVLHKCLTISCGKNYQEINGKCVELRNHSDNNEALNSECTKVVLERDLFTVLENRSVYVNHTKTIHIPGEYEVNRKVNGTFVEILLCADEVLLIQFSPAQRWLSEIILIVSIACLTVHLLIYSLLPHLHNLPGKILISLSGSLLFSKLFFLLRSYARYTYWLCKSFAMVTHLGYLSTFFWMNVMAIDICRAFRSSLANSKSKQRKTFIIYSLYAWIFPIVIVITSILVDQLFPDSPYRPQYGGDVCWIRHKRALLLFFALPLALLLFANTVLFIITAVNLRKTSKQTKMVATKFSNRIRYFLYVKLAVLFGVTWLFGFLAALAKISALWYPFIILNGLQGAFIFFSFTFKRKIFRMVREKIYPRKESYSFRHGKNRCNIYSSNSNLSTLLTSSSSVPSLVPTLRNDKVTLKSVGNVEDSVRL